MAINWNMTASDGERSIVVFLPNFTTKTVSDTHPNFNQLLDLLVNLDPESDDIETADEVLSLVDIVSQVSEKLVRLSERITTDCTNIYFDGDELDSSVAEFLLTALRKEGLIGGNSAVEETSENDVSWQAIVKFLEKLYQNPSKKSVKHLYSFISRYHLTIRPNGDFIAFKGLRDNYTSVHSGPGIVNGVRYSHANLANNPGNVVEIQRSYVDARRKVGCSTGLHAGTFEYASNFSHGKVVAVAINPRDVVSVPSDCAYQKLRVARYEVLNDVPGDYVRNDDDILWEDEYDEDGYDEYGYDEYGYDEEGFDEFGYDEDGYDREGYDSEGYDEKGYNRGDYSKDEETPTTSDTATEADQAIQSFAELLISSLFEQFDEEDK